MESAPDFDIDAEIAALQLALAQGDIDGPTALRKMIRAYIRSLDTMVVSPDTYSSTISKIRNIDFSKNNAMNKMQISVIRLLEKYKKIQEERITIDIPKQKN